MFDANMNTLRNGFKLLPHSLRKFEDMNKNGGQRRRRLADIDDVMDHFGVKKYSIGETKPLPHRERDK